MSLWTWIAGVPSESEMNAADTAALERYNAAVDRAVADGRMDSEDAQNRKNLMEQIDSQQQAVNATLDTEIQTGLKEGASQGLDNVLNFPGQVVDKVGQGLSQSLWGVLKNIPWWVYLGGLVALFIWMGGLSLLRGRLAKGVA
jgi:hypothetical protein